MLIEQIRKNNQFIRFTKYRGKYQISIHYPNGYSRHFTYNDYAQANYVFNKYINRPISKDQTNLFE